jgi:hypothetical protein
MGRGLPGGGRVADGSRGGVFGVVVGEQTRFARHQRSISRTGVRCLVGPVFKLSEGGQRAYKTVDGQGFQRLSATSAKASKRGGGTGPGRSGILLHQHRSEEPIARRSVKKKSKRNASLA